MNKTCLLLFFLIPGVFLAGCNAIQTPQSASAASDISVLFFDDFSNPNSGWDIVAAENAASGYMDGAFRMRLGQPETVFLATPGHSFVDVAIEVQASRLNGPEKNDYGVVCRYQNDENFYAFFISSDGYYAIFKFKGGEQFRLGEQDWQSSNTILGGEHTNAIYVRCVGESLSLAVNMVPILSVKDADFKQGDVGLVAGTYETPGVEIGFDNFRVSRP